MTYHTYNPSTDTLEVGTKIRLAGREGEIYVIDNNPLVETKHLIRWPYCSSDNWVDLNKFIFEIADKPVKPLTIDKRVKHRIGALINIIEIDIGDVGDLKWDSVIELENYLNSLEEV